MKSVIRLLTSLAILGFALFFLLKVSIIRQSSFVPQADAQSCAAAAIPAGVLVEFPGCTGTDCLFTQASCKWDSQADAASYSVTVTEVETGSIIKNNESQSASTSKVVFAIQQGKTYKCDVTAVSACGGVSAAATDQLLCQADAMLTPTVAAEPTATPVPPTATPTIAKPGGLVETIALSSGILIAVIGGILLLVL